MPLSRIKIVGTAIAALLLLWAATAAGSEAVTIDQQTLNLSLCLDLARRTNPAGHLARQNLRAVRERTSEGPGGRMFGPPDGSTTTLTMADAEAMKAALTGIRHIAPFTMHVAQTVVRELFGDQDPIGEALIVTLFGGIGGTLLGVAVSLAIAGIKKMPAVLSWEPFVLAIVFSAVVGIVTGLQPARKAAGMDPVAAIKG